MPITNSGHDSNIIDSKKIDTLASSSSLSNEIVPITNDDFDSVRNKDQILSMKKIDRDHGGTALQNFVKESILEPYSFDGDDKSTVLCRCQQNGKNCINLEMPTSEVLDRMQKLDFFCALSHNVTSTEIECRKVV